MDLSNPLVDGLKSLVALTDDEEFALADLVARRQRRLVARKEIIRDGERTDTLFVLLEGFACRMRLLHDGRRQIVAFLVPGDFCNLQNFVIDKADQSVVTLTSVRIAEIPRDSLRSVLREQPGLERALWWKMTVDCGVQREWLVNIGQRTAVERVSHILCELFTRMSNAQQIDGMSCELPLSQSELADMLGISLVHMNRTLRDLRTTGLITYEPRMLTIHDFKTLRRLGGFNPAYLHLKLDARPSPSSFS